MKIVEVQVGDQIYVKPVMYTLIICMYLFQAC